LTRLLLTLSKVVPVGTWLVGIPILIIAIIAFTVYMKGKHAKGELAPAETPDETQPPADRERTWDPHERYDGKEPPAAR
jgi:hypothetical protein